MSNSFDPIRIPSTATTGSKVESTFSSSLSSGPTTVILKRYLLRFFLVDEICYTPMNLLSHPCFFDVLLKCNKTRLIC